MVGTALYLMLQLTSATPAAAPPPPVATPAERKLTTPYLKSGAMNSSDYPKAALRQEQEGRVLVSYTVTAMGRAKECRIMRSSGHPALDEASCRIVDTRYVLEPARDEDGRAVPLLVSQWIVWEMEPPETPPVTSPAADKD